MKISSFLALCLLIISVAACSFIDKINNKPSLVVKNWYACYNKKDADCMLLYLSDGLVRSYGGANAFKVKISQSFPAIKEVAYTHIDEASTETTSEVSVAEGIAYKDPNIPPFINKLLIKLIKDSNGKWKIHEIQNLGQIPN